MRNKEKVSAYNKTYRLNNPHKIKTLQDNYYTSHRLARIKNARIWALKNPEKALLTRQTYMKTPQGRLTSIKGSAKTRGIEYNLTDAEALALLISPCYYCLEKEGISIDRIDSTKGYRLKNCVACCRMCNYMKNTYIQKEFIAKCKAIAICHALD